MTNEQIEKINAALSEMSNRSTDLARCLHRTESDVNAATAQIKVENMPKPAVQITAETPTYSITKQNANGYKSPTVKSTIRGPHRA